MRYRYFVIGPITISLLLATAEQLLETGVQVLVAGPLPVAPGVQGEGVVVVEEGYGRDEQQDSQQGGHEGQRA